MKLSKYQESRRPKKGNYVMTWTGWRKPAATVGIGCRDDKHPPSNPIKVNKLGSQPGA